MTTLQPGYALVVDALADAGVSTVFGLMGDDTAALISDLPRRDIAYLSARHENIAVGMADGYEWATGERAVAIISRGPGLTNAMTALTSIGRRPAKVLVIVGDAPVRADSSKTDPKAIDQVSVAEAAGLFVERVVEPEAVLEGIARSLRAVGQGRATLLIVPSDVQSATVAQRDAPSASTEQDPVPEPSQDTVDRAVELLSNATAPFILAGRGAHLSGATEVLQALAEKGGALLGTTLLGNGLFSGDPYSVGIVGGFASDTALHLVQTSDVILVVGASLSTFTTEHGQLLAHATVIHLDINPDVINSRIPATVGLVGDARSIAQTLHDRLEPRSTAHRSSQTAAAIARAAERTGIVAANARGLHPEDLVRRLDQLLPKDRVVITDGGHNLGYPPMFLAVQGPGHFRHTYFFGAVGMGLGVALGAAAARGQAPVVLVIGDGGLSMALGDLSTAVEYGLPLTVIVLNDRAYGAERHFLDLIGRPTELALFTEVDFASVAGALGWQAVRVTCPDELEQSATLLAEARTGPLLLDVRIDPDVRASWIESGMVRGHDGSAAAKVS